MKKRWFAGLLAVMLILSLTACGGAAKGGGAMTDMARPEDVAMEETNYGWVNGAMAAEEAPAAVDGGETSRLQDAKMILRASLEVENTDFEAGAAGLEDLVESLGGYLEHASVSDYGGYRSAGYTVRVPAEQFEAFLEQAGALCHVVYQDRGQENVSEAYYDTESRLTTQRTKLERLQTLLGRAESMEDIITIESAIAETELAIEQLTGTLRHYDALVDFATITVTLREVYKLSNVEEPASGFLGRLGAAFAGGWTGFVDSLEDLAVFAAYNWMWLLVLAAAAVVAVRAVRKKGAFHLPIRKKKDDKRS